MVGGNASILYAHVMMSTEDKQNITAVTVGAESGSNRQNRLFPFFRVNLSKGSCNLRFVGS
jgi:hypothetical protein